MTMPRQRRAAWIALATLAASCSGDATTNPVDDGDGPPALEARREALPHDSLIGPYGLVPLSLSLLGRTDTVAVTISVSDTMLAVLQATGTAPPEQSLTRMFVTPGVAGALLVARDRPGPLVIRFSVPEAGFSDSATVILGAGQTAQFYNVLPSDTALYVSDTVRLRYEALRFGRQIITGLGLVSLTPECLTVLPDARITVTAICRAGVVGSGGGRLDTVVLSVVPPGRIAAVDANVPYGNIVLFDLNGRHIRRVAPALPPQTPFEGLRWTGGGRLLLHAQPPYDVRSVYEADTATGATVLRISGATPGLIAASQPSPTRDHTAIVFTGSSTDESTEIWRAAVDGSSPARLGETAARGVLDWNPSPSPDGSLVAFATNRVFNQTHMVLRVLHVATGAIDSLELPGDNPVWSPDGALIAFQDGASGPIAVVAPDGSGFRRVTPFGYHGWFDWSPDSKWLIAQPLFHDRLQLVHVSSGLILPLPDYTVGFTHLAWRP